MAPIVLSMDVHCNGCAKDIRKALKKFDWVESVSASYETGLVNVEVEGERASYQMAVLLQLRLSRKMREEHAKYLLGIIVGLYTQDTRDQGYPIFLSSVMVYISNHK
uniref:HMA domain-containing protein n=1 Tax=Aegilops tauschii TaxID=37682 RepID=M8D7M0_AEGTA